MGMKYYMVLIDYPGEVVLREEVQGAFKVGQYVKVNSHEDYKCVQVDIKGDVCESILKQGVVHYDW